MRYAVLYDFSVAYKVVLSVLLLVAAFFVRGMVDIVLIVLATGLVLVAEIFNSAIEALCDFIEDQHNEKIKVIKDMAAAAVGICILIWLFVLSFEAWQVALAVRD